MLFIVGAYGLLFLALVYIVVQMVRGSDEVPPQLPPLFVWGERIDPDPWGRDPQSLIAESAHNPETGA